MTHEMACALAGAGYISAAEYIRLCAENGWIVSNGGGNGK
jgi:hypothetical protein